MLRIIQIFDERPKFAESMQIGKDINRAKGLLEAGDIVAIPTETVYGLAADATNLDAVQKIFSAKNRPVNNPLILHFANMEGIDPFVSSFPAKLKNLAAHFWPGPLTILLPKASKVLQIVNAGLKEVAVRIPNHPLTLELLERVNVPLAAPSANPFGYISPTLPEHVLDQLGNKVPYILDGGPCSRGIESTIVSLENDQITILRLGAITEEEISEVSGEVIQLKNNATENPRSPGMLPYHYSPRTPIVLTSEWKEDWKNENIGAITHSWKHLFNDKKNVIQLPDLDQWHTAAHLLYQSMYNLDQKDLLLIAVEKFPNEGLGKTINDRLLRAARKRN